ncbi:MAG: oligoribonuclease [Alteromonas naphthalenivorans]
MNHNNLIWIDLEMTGLDPVKDKILEIATIVTDSELNIIEEGPVIVINQSNECLKAMDPWCTKVHGKSGLLQKVVDSDTTEEQAQEQTLDFLYKHCRPDKSPLCGNSVWMDRFFFLHHMPDLYKFLNYRTVDVSSIKEVAKRWYPESPALDFKKKGNHRALDDIRESIEELRHYKDCFFVAD